MMKKLNIKVESPDVIAGRYGHLQVTPRMPGFGAWIDGVNLNGDLKPEVRAELRRAWLEFGVIFFRNQTRLDPDRHVELSRVFGGGPHEGNSYLKRATNPDVELLIADHSRQPSADTWHTDISWSKNPPIGTIIQIQEKPPVGGNTSWISTRKAYDCLAEPLKAFLQELKAIHSHLTPRTLVLDNASKEKNVAILQNESPVEHPVIWVHPLTGEKSIYVNELWTVRVCDMHPAESNGILRMLFDWMLLPEFQLHHTWEENGVAVWDNFATQHYAQADYFPLRRVNQRVTFRAPE